MTSVEFWLMLLARWLHILSAGVALGVPLYLRFVQMPALGTLDDPTRGRVGDELARRWRIIVHVAITVFLVTGLYTFLGVARWREFPQDFKFRYHMYFGIKTLIALVMFFIASALAGRSARLAAMRANARLWLTVLILLGVLVVIISGTMRFMPQTPTG